MSEKQYRQAPEMEIDPTKKYQAIIELEKGGTITIDLLAAEAPKTVNNFIFYSLIPNISDRKWLYFFVFK